ncbi:MAG: tetratricopeptide repeat-containing sensor histidine kinase [Chitinophagales bacterium]
MRYCFIFFLFFSISSSLIAQENFYIDSLKKEYTQTTIDTFQAKLLNQICRYYEQTNIDSAFKYANIGLKLTKKMQWKKGIAAFYTSFGNTYSNQGKLDIATTYIKKSLALNIKNNDTINMASSYNNLGSIANSQSDYITATNYYNKSLQLAIASKNNINICYAMQNLALVYAIQRNFKKAFEYINQAINAASKTNEESLLINPYALLANIYSDINQYDSAIFYYQKALLITKTYDYKTDEAEILNSLGTIYMNLKQYSNAINAYLSSEKIWNTYDEHAESAIINKGFIGDFYQKMAFLKLNNDKEAIQQIPTATQQLLQLSIQYNKEAIEGAKSLNNKALLSNFLESISEAYTSIGNYKLAYENYKASIEINDSIFSQENKNRIAQLESQHEMDKKNAEIKQQQANIKAQRKNLLILFIVLIAVILIGFLFYRLSQIRKQRNQELRLLNTQLDNANKTKAKFFSILSHDLRSPVASLINFLQLQQIDSSILSESEKEEQQHKTMHAVTSLLDVMEGVLLWSKGQMEHFTPEKKQINISDLFKYIQNYFITVTNIQITFLNSDNLFLYTDENYVKTIMHNLTQNAVQELKENEHGKIEWKAKKENNQIILSITDNGKGMSKEQMKKFEANTNINSEKHGLGLYIIKDMVTTINCEITIQSKVNEGTTINLHF